MELQKEGKIYITELAKRIGVSRPTIYYHIIGKHYKGKFYGASLKGKVAMDKFGNLTLVSTNFEVKEKNVESKGGVSTQIKPKKKMGKEEKIEMVKQGFKELENREKWEQKDYDNYYKLIEIAKKLKFDPEIIEEKEEIFRQKVAEKYERG